jgi:hypothetical protein
MNTNEKQNMTNKKLDTLNSLVQCHFSVTAPATNALNRTATARTAAAAGAAKRVARVYNTILNAKGTAIGKAISLQQRTGVAVRRFGLPIDLGGIFLPVRKIADVQNVFDDAMIELDQIREDIIRTYPEMTEPLRADLGGFADEVRIPTATEVASRFTMTLTILNRPVAVGQLEGVVSEVANRVRAESQRQAEELLHKAHVGPVKDLREQLGIFADALRNAQRLHLTQFDKLREEVCRVKDLNVLELPEVDELVRQAAAVAYTPICELDNATRVEIARKAESVSAKADATLSALGL